jgi:hypothetical protein
MKGDDFLIKHGYTFDFVLVFDVIIDDYKDKLSNYQKEYSMKSIISRLKNQNLETRLFYSVQKMHVYVKIRAKPSVLENEASRIHYRLPLDAEKVKSKVHNGRKGRWNPINITDEFKQSSISPFDYLYGPYVASKEVKSLYKSHTLRNQKHSIFKATDRIKLIISIIESKEGCCLSLGRLQEYNAIAAAFPIHDYQLLKELTRKWIKFWQRPSKQPLNAVRDYFGESVAFYFVYLQHYIEHLIKVAILGALCHVVSAIYNADESPINLYFTFFVVLWATYMIETWKQKQSRTSMEWGTVGVENEETVRPTFRGENISSPVDGGEYVFEDDNVRVLRYILSLLALIFSMCISIGFVAAVSSLEWYLSLDGRSNVLVYASFDPTKIIIAFIYALCIMFCSHYFEIIAYKLSDYENYRTDTDYQDALVNKLFAFEIVNCNAPLWYVGFVKGFVGFSCYRDSCLGDLATTVVTIFLTNLLWRVFQEVGIRKISMIHEQRLFRKGTEPGSVMSPIEEQYSLAEASLKNTMRDYLSLVVQFNYAVLYVAAFPLAPFLALVSAYVQLRIDAWKFVLTHRRPIPKSAEDIGTWEDCLQLLSVTAIVSNFGIIFFTSRFFVNETWQIRWIMFICLEYIIFVGKYIFSVIVEDIEGEVEIQIQRSEFLVSKVIKDLKDDDDSVIEIVESNKNLTIHRDDEHDWIEESDDV